MVLSCFLFVSKIIISKVISLVKYTALSSLWRCYAHTCPRFESCWFQHCKVHIFDWLSRTNWSNHGINQYNYYFSSDIAWFKVSMFVLLLFGHCCEMHLNNMCGQSSVSRSKHVLLLNTFNSTTHTQMFTVSNINHTLFCKRGWNAGVLNMFRKCWQSCV